jgi:F-type H+-transporting ATPase subunit b
VINVNIGTVLIHLASFLAMVAALNKLLFGPLLRVMDARQAKVSGNQSAAVKATHDLAAMKSTYLEKLEAARKQAGQEKEALRKSAESEEEKIIRAARERAGDLVADLREKIAAEFQGARAELVSQSQNMGRRIAARILGREV